MLSIIHQVVLIKVQQVINDALRESIDLNNELIKKLQNINSKTIAVVVSNLPFDLSYTIHLTDNKIVIKNGITNQVDLKIKITPGSLMRAKLTSVDRGLRNRDIELIGDLSLALELQTIMNTIEYSFKDKLQEKLADIISDSFAWQFINILDKISDRISIKNAELSEQVADYLHTEKNIIVSRIELEHFYQYVDDIQNDTARLTARIDRLIKTI